MPSPNATPTPITPPRVPLVDPRTGLIDRAWYMFFLSLLGAATTVYETVDLGPSPESLLASYDAALQALAQNVDTQPLPVDLSVELTKQVEAAGLVDQSSALLSQIAEMQKQLEALSLLPAASQGTVTAVTATSPVVSSGGTAPDISMPAASTSVSGYLTSTDWNTFNSKAPATSGTSILYGNGSGGFSNVTIGSGVSFTLGTLSATGSGGTVTSVTGTSPVVSSGGTTPAISLATAYGDTLNPYASKTANYVLAAPNGSAGVPTFRLLMAADIPALPYGAGTVTSVSVVSANGLAGTVATSTTTPAITLSTTVTGLLKGNGTAISAAAVNTDYQGVIAPVTKTADFTVSNGDIWYINNKSGSTCVVTLPAASSWSGRTLTFKNMQAQLLNSASSNVVPIDSTTAGTSILLNVIGNWATMVSDGTNWVIMQAASNNNLLLE